MKLDIVEKRSRGCSLFFLIVCWSRQGKKREDYWVRHFWYNELLRRIRSDNKIQMLVHNLPLGAEVIQHEGKWRWYSIQVSNML